MPPPWEELGPTATLSGSPRLVLHAGFTSGLTTARATAFAERRPRFAWSASTATIGPPLTTAPRLRAPDRRPGAPDRRTGERRGPHPGRPAPPERAAVRPADAHSS